MLLIRTSTWFTRYMVVNCMFPYNIASLMLEILCLKYALNDPLGHNNPREWVSTKRCAYVGIGLHMQFWLLVCRVDLVYMGCESKETLAALIKYKSSCLGPKTFTNVFSEVPQKQKTLNSMSRLELEGLVLISRIPSPSMVFLVSFHIFK